MQSRGLVLLGAVVVSVVACSDDESSGGDSAIPDGSNGCGAATSVATGSYVEQSLSVGSATRPFFVRLPNGYDPQRAYPVVFENHGCSSNADRQNNNVPLANQVGDNAILVRGRAAGNCWDTKDDGPDGAYLETLRTEVDKRWCVDTNRRYLTGYSGGAFMAHVLACRSGEHYRGVATIAGGQGGSSCTPDMPALLIHDADDGTVNVSASRTTRDGYITRNGCNASEAPTDYTPDPCVASVSCDAPVVYCETNGRGHDRQDAFAAPIFWSFLNSLD